MLCIFPPLHRQSCRMVMWGWRMFGFVFWRGCILCFCGGRQLDSYVSEIGMLNCIHIVGIILQRETFNQPGSTADHRCIFFSIHVRCRPQPPRQLSSLSRSTETNSSKILEHRHLLFSIRSRHITVLGVMAVRYGDVDSKIYSISRLLFLLLFPPSTSGLDFLSRFSLTLR